MPKTSVAALEVPYTSIPQWYHTLNEATYYDLNLPMTLPLTHFSNQDERAFELLLGRRWAAAHGTMGNRY